MSETGWTGSGLHHTGTVSPEIRPLWRTKAAGFALTCRHIPTQQSVPTMTPDEYTTWAYEYWYGQVFKNDMPDLIDDTRSWSWTHATRRRPRSVRWTRCCGRHSERAVS